MRRVLPAVFLLVLAGLSACMHKPATPEEIATYTSTYIIFFETNSADLTPDTYARVQRAATAVEKIQPQMIEIAGYSDGTGSEAANHDLSKRRTETVAKTLVDLGIDPALITKLPMGAATDGWGPTADRRVRISLIKDEGSPTGTPAPANAAAAPAQ